jgi:Helix-turn-helix domain
MDRGATLMSVRVMSWVWDQDLPTTKKMLLLAIADHADDDGDNAWPSKARLAKKVSVMPGHVRRMLRELEDDGWITTATQRGGTLETPSDRRPNRYKINLERGCVGEPPLAQRGRMEAPPRGRTQEPPRGCVGEPLIISTTPDTSSEQRERARDALFEALVEACAMDMERLTSSARGVLNKATKELRQVDATPEQVLLAARRYAERFPSAAVTPTALAKHFPALTSVQSTTERRSVLSGEVCEVCAGTGWQALENAERTVTRCSSCNGLGRTGP